MDKDVQNLEYSEGERNYVIAYSLKEQKRANDLKERELTLKEIWIAFAVFIVILLFFLYLKLDSMDVVSKIVAK